MPVGWYASVCVIFRFVIRFNTYAMNLQIRLIEEPHETVDIFSNLFDYPRVLVFCFILLLIDVLVQQSVFSYMTESARNIITIPVAINPVNIGLSDFGNFESNGFWKFFLRIILSTRTALVC